MMAILVVFAWVIVSLAVLDEQVAFRESALIGLTAIGLLIVVSTEVLSLFRGITTPHIISLWLAVVLLAAFGLRDRVSSGWAILRRWRPHELGPVDWVPAAALFVLFGGTLASALLYPTTNYDSLAYHMPRVFFWMQNQTVAHFPTAEARQLFSSTFVEYSVLQLKALSGGGERLANLVQWTAYVFAVLTVSLIAKELGASRSGQHLSAIVGASVPMALLQASTTQNDLTCALWCLIAIYAGLRLLGALDTNPTKLHGSAWGLTSWLAIATGLAMQ